jgi:enoyl-CoA hydratase
MSNILCTQQFCDHSHIALLKINRPKVLNAINNDVLRELRDHLRQLDDNGQTRVVILTGDDRAFAAGADLKSLAMATPVAQILDERARLWKELTLFSKPLIAAVNGFALGGGCELAMSCDFIIASDTAKFGQPEIKVGIMPGAGGTQRFTNALGKSKANYYLMTGEMIDASEALDFGLVAKVVPSMTLMQECFEAAKKIAEKAPVSMRLMKESVNKSFEMPLKDGLDFERRNFCLTFSTKDAFEGMNAFLEKRSATYEGL